MKKKYIQPACEVVEIKIESNLLVPSVHDVDNNADLGGGGNDSGYEGDVRARQVVGVDWDDWEE